MKKQLLVIVALMVATCVNAQVWQKGNREVAPKLQNAPAATNRATIEPADGQLWWGYMAESDLAKTDGIGVGSPSVPFLAAIYVPANHEQIGDATVKAVRIYVLDGLGSTMSNVSVWVSKTLPATIDAADYVQSVKSLTDGANDITLNTPYVVNNEAFYIGYAVTSTNSYPIMCCGTEDAPNAFLICAPGRVDWSDLNGNGFGKLAFQMLVEGAVQPDYSVTPSDFGTSYVQAGESAAIAVKITNNGQQTVNSISYTITTNGNTSAEQTVNVDPIAFNRSATCIISLPAVNDPIKYAETITITKVNGQANEAKTASASGNVICMTSKPAFVPVIEEFTGTWCGWCPVGFEGLKYVHETYGDKVVLIAAHYSDPMAITDYNPIVNQASGFPSSFVNRSLDLYPHPQYFEYYLPQVMEMTVPGSIELTANWTSSAQTAIQLNTATTFRYSDNSAQYGIAFVLVEDGLTGTGSSWNQANYLSGNSNYASMSFWYNAGSSVSGLEFDHVAVAAWDIQNGVSNSVPAAFEADQALPYSYTADISSKSVIQDKSKLKAVALLIDKTNGMIINAAQAQITSNTDGIQNAQTAKDATVEARYTLDGRRISAPEQGLNIIKMTDGSVRKVVVK